MPANPELFRALGALCEPPEPEHTRLTGALGLPAPADAAAFTEVHVFQLVPYAAPYLSPDGMLGGEAADRVAGFWRALGLTPPAEPDHLAALLALYAHLGQQAESQHTPARAAAWRDAQRALLWEHLLTWVPAYARAMMTLGSRFHTAWARLLRGALLGEARALSAPPGPALHLRDMPDLPSTGSAGFARALLAPARSGLLLTRRDLAMAASGMGLGARLGGRAFILQALIGQDREATLRWLAERAAWWAGRHRLDDPPLGGIAAHFTARARTSVRLLNQTLMEAT